MMKKLTLIASVVVFLAMILASLMLALMFNAFMVSATTNDNTPPVTTKTVDPASPNGLNGWYVSLITIYINATDDNSGVNYTVVLVDGSVWANGTGTIKIVGFADGEYTLQYYSVDNAGNIENTHTQNYKIDKTLPNATFTHSVSELTVNFDATESTDATSGIDRYEWDFGCMHFSMLACTGSGNRTSYTYDAEGTYTVTLTVWDKAGNYDTDTAQVVVSETPPVPEFPLGVEVAVGIGLMIAVVYMCLRKRKTKPTAAKRFTTKTSNLDSC